jgi:hypothetical protein
MSHIENNKKARVIALYLPQFYPIPENDSWWGKGFTEWTNVGKAKPLFRGHYQPRIPADLGYYDLRLPEVRKQQSEMARYAGIEGFCYYHYWFGNGKRLLERPFNEVLESGKPDFPFCLAWANESWSGIWHGSPEKILIEQTYPGIEDYIRHFYANLNAFFDDRYIRVDGKPMFYVYKPLNIPDTQVFLDSWRELAVKEGLKGIHFVGHSWDKTQANQIIAYGYDAVNTYWQQGIMKNDHITKYTWNRLSEIMIGGKYQLSVWDYKEFATKLSSDLDSQQNYYPTILSGYDNSPRSGRRGRIFINYTPEIFDVHVKEVLRKIENKRYETKIAFLKSWNEWGEGNYIEPDLKFGWDYLDVLKNNLF